MFKTAYLTDVGLKRTNNEDALLVAEDCGLFVVSDGMGGHERGEVASQIIIDCFKDTFCHVDIDDETVPSMTKDTENDNKSELINKLNSVIMTSTDRIMDYAKKNVINGQMGATVVGLYKIENKEELVVFHLGDSRGYRVRNYRIDRITTDHSKYEDMKRSSKYSEEELSEVSRSTITRAVGNFNAFPLEVNYLPLENDDFYLLCSDGVSDLCSDEELLNIIIEERNNLNKLSLRIKSLVYDRGAKDNLSLILINYTSDSN